MRREKNTSRRRRVSARWEGFENDLSRHEIRYPRSSPPPDSPRETLSTRRSLVHGGACVRSKQLSTYKRVFTRDGWLKFRQFFNVCFSVRSTRRDKISTLFITDAAYRSVAFKPYVKTLTDLKAVSASKTVIYVSIVKISWVRPFRFHAPRTYPAAGYLESGWLGGSPSFFC